MKIALTPIDTWFFRDSTPFDQEASPQTAVSGVFPPYPTTVAGAVRAALARARGWNGIDRWDTELTTALGDGPAMGPLRMTGPVVLRGEQAMFPLPLHVIATREDSSSAWRASGWMAPGPEVDCDLGRVRLAVPAADEEGPELVAPPAARPWVTAHGLQEIAAGRLPVSEDLVGSPSLWTVEPRVGIQRRIDTRTVEHGMLFSTRHVRLRAGVGIGIELAGLPIGWSLPGVDRTSPGGPTTLSLGGESRLATVAHWSGFSLGASSDDAFRVGHPVLIALTPLRLARGAIAGRVPAAPGLRIASACAGPAIRIGGWDSRHRSPLPLTDAVAPGTTLFCHADAVDADGADLERGLVRIGSDIASGFGLCAIAHVPWKEIS